MPNISDNFLDKICRMAIFGGIAYLDDAKTITQLRERNRNVRDVKKFCRINLLENPEFNVIYHKLENTFDRKISELRSLYRFIEKNK